MQNKGKVNTGPFLKLTELLSPGAAFSMAKLLPKNLKKWNMGKPQGGNVGTDSTNLTFQMAELGA